MTDRLKGCTVAFAKDIREDDAKAIIDAILQLRGVASVRTSVVTGDDLITRMRIDNEWRERLLNLITKEEKR